jgi:hypothetical protein
MTLRKKVTLILLFGFFIQAILLAYVFYNVQAKGLREKYIQQYLALTDQIGHTIVQLEETADSINRSAVEYLFEHEKRHGLPSTAELNTLAQRLGVWLLDLTNS